MPPHLARRALADLYTPNPRIFWADVLLTGAVGWGAILCGILGLGGWAGVALAWLAASLAMFRASLFLHELSHLGQAVPGVRLAWNLFWGVPFLLPSYLYERIHPDHHRRQVYASTEDPEYTPLAFQPVARTLAVSCFGMLLPLGVALRFLIITPLSVFHRRFVDERLNSLASNPAYRARPLTGRKLREAIAAELAACLWGWSAVGLVLGGVLPLRAVAVWVAVLAGATFGNQIRALVAHRYASRGVTGDDGIVDDSLNLEPRSALFRAVWPVDARLHALHHLAPALPYHHLAEAHRRMLVLQPEGSSYRRASSPGVLDGLAQLFAAARRRPGAVAARERE